MRLKRKKIIMRGRLLLNIATHARQCPLVEGARSLLLHIASEKEKIYYARQHALEIPATHARQRPLVEGARYLLLHNASEKAYFIMRGSMRS
jgi:hypothetical protein